MGFFGSKFSKFESELPDVSGKVFAITGTTSGTGFTAAECVARHNGEVILLNRPSSRSVASLEKLRELVPGGKFVAIDCDLQDFASVRKAAAEIKEKYPELYCLSNNAGIMATPDEITKDGYDKQMQTNHHSHFLLSRELLPLLAKSAEDTGDARLVQHSSMARDMVPGDKLLKEKYLTKKEKDGMLGGNEVTGFMKGPPMERYQHTKLANSVFCQALHGKLSSSTKKGYQNVLSLCAHPGISKTNLADHLRQGGAAGVFGAVVEALLLQTSEDGSMGLLKAMMDTRENVQAGMLYGPKGMTGYPVALPPKDHESDAASKEMMWKASEEAIGATFDI